MQAFFGDLKELTTENEDYRHVLFTGTHSQLVLMTIQPGEEIGNEVHLVEQMLYVVEGEGEAIVGGQSEPFDKGEAVVIPAGVFHNIRNTGDEPLKLFTIYAPPQHPAGTIQKRKPKGNLLEAVLV